MSAVASGFRRYPLVTPAIAPAAVARRRRTASGRRTGSRQAPPMPAVTYALATTLLCFSRDTGQEAEI
jgi:hypothetical protein